VGSNRNVSGNQTGGVEQKMFATRHRPSLGQSGQGRLAAGIGNLVSVSVRPQVMVSERLERRSFIAPPLDVLSIDLHAQPASSIAEL